MERIIEDYHSSSAFCGSAHDLHLQRTVTTWALFKELVSSSLWSLGCIALIVFPFFSTKTDWIDWLLSVSSFAGGVLGGIFVCICGWSQVMYNASTQRQLNIRTQTDDEQSLQRLLNSLVPLFDSMPAPKVWIEPAKHFGVAYDDKYAPQESRRSYVPRAHACGGAAICFRQDVFSTLTPAELVWIMKHELIHSWMDWKNMSILDSETHGPIFREKAKEVGCD